MKLLTH